MLLSKWFKKIFSRVLITGLLVALQCLWLFAFSWDVLRSMPWISSCFTLVTIVMGLHIVRRDGNPAYKIAWIFFIGLVPVFGGVMYLLFGNKRPSRVMRQHMDSVEKAHIYELAAVQELPDTLSQRQKSTCEYIANYGPYPAWENTNVRYFSQGEDVFAQLLKELSSAKKFIFLEFFIISEGALWREILAILKQKAAQGVDVRVVYDDVGSLSTLPKNFVVELETSGIHCLPFNPMVPFVSLVMNHRDHRKIAVIDGTVAYSGGVNIADEYINRKKRFGHWKDTAIRLEGAAAWNFTVMFLNLWNAFRKTDLDYDAFRPDAARVAAIESDGVVQPYSDSPLDDELLAENIYLDILAQATNYVYIFTPYLVVDHEMVAALGLAAKRGVDVRLVTPAIPDKKLVFRLTRSYYPPLLKSGVKIYEYTPGFMHAKSYVSDDNMAVVGTINMDYRSLYLHFECGTLLQNNSEIVRIRYDAERTIAQSRAITLADCRDSFFGRLFDDMLRVISPLV